MLPTYYITKASLLGYVCICLGAFSAVANDLEINILSFPEIAAWKYRPDMAVETANALISAGKDNACAALEKTAGKTIDLTSDFAINEKVCLLCRLLFTATNSNQILRPPRIGDARLMSTALVPADWPDLPFVIVSNMPLSVTSGYSFDGVAERGQDYLAYCKANGTFRSQLFSKPTSLAVSNTLDQVFNSAKWKSIPWDTFGHTTFTNLDWEQSSNSVENFVKDDLRQQAAKIDKN